MIMILECLVVSFILFLPCVVAISNGTHTIIGNPIIASVLAGIMFPIFGH